MHKTKIICTLGPASGTVELMKQLIKNGMSAARINFSHGTYESHSVVIDNLIKAREELGKPIPLVLDTKVPEIITKTLKDGQNVTLEQGNIFNLTTEDIIGDENRVAVTYEGLTKDLKSGDKILIDDGLIELKVQSIDGNDAVCEVVNGGILGERKGINIPDVHINLPSLTQKDIEDIKFGIEKGFDYIAASFIRSAEDVLKIKEVLDKNGGSDILIISKIENRDGVNNIDEILDVSDGIMVARGDLGVEIPPQEVPLVQKELIKKANAKGKLVVTATQMLESMIQNPRPTRAEANDVANAIFDGTDVIMLSGETAKGKYPIEAVKMMATIAETTENSINYTKRLRLNHSNVQKNVTNAICYATCSTSSDLGAACIVTITKGGYTPRMVAMFKPAIPIMACTMEERVLRQVNLIWGCIPVMFDIESMCTDECFEKAMLLAGEKGLAKSGDVVVLTGGMPIGITGNTNVLKVLTLD